MYQYQQRIDWNLAGIWLLICWVIAMIDPTCIVVAIAWTAMIIITDLGLVFANSLERRYNGRCSN